MKKMISWFLILAAFLAACSNAPSEVTVTSQVTVTSEPPPTPTETRVPPTATATPIPTYSIEQLTAMSSADKLAMAPQVGTAPADVVASFLPKGADAASITWGEKTLTYWERVVSYHGKVGGQEVTLYYDLESGQWAKKYDSFESLSQIPAGQIPDVMVLGLGGDLGDRLIRNKLQYNYDWISQPQAMTEDGKQIFRDEKGYPKAVFDPATKTWLTPEQADVNVTMEKFLPMFSGYSYVGDDGKTYSGDVFFKRTTIMADPAQIEGQPNGTGFIIFNPSGEISIWSSQKEAAQRSREGAAVMTIENGIIFSPSLTMLRVAFDQHQKGNQTIFVTFNDMGVARNQIQGDFSPGFGLKFERLPKGNVESVFRMPKIFSSYSSSGEELSVKIINPDLWLEELIQAGVTRISIRCVEG